MKPQFRSPQQRYSRERHRLAGAIRHTTGALRIFRPSPLPPATPLALRKYVPKDAKLQPLVRAKRVPPLSRSPESLLLRPRSTRCLQLGHPKHCAPNRGAWLRQPAKVKNSLALTVRLNRMPSVPPRRDYDHSELDTLQNAALRLMCAYRSAASLVRLLPLWSLCKRRSLRDATCIAPHSIDKRRRARRGLPRQTVRPPSARSG